MYIHQSGGATNRNRKRSGRVRAKLRAKNRRRTNRMAGKRLSARRK